MADAAAAWVSATDSLSVSPSFRAATVTAWAVPQVPEPPPVKLRVAVVPAVPAGPFTVSAPVCAEGTVTVTVTVTPSPGSVLSFAV